MSDGGRGVLDFDSYVELQKRYPRAVGNDYMLPADLRRGFESGVLTIGADDQALFLFEKREGFTKLHFRLIDSCAAVAPQEEPLAAFLTYREGFFPEAAADWLLGQGFVETKTLRRHSAYSITGELSLDGVERASADEAYAMLGGYFSAVEADLPCRELFEGALCVRSQDGRPVGMYYMGRTPVVAVAREARGKGVGRALFRAYAAIKAGEGKKSAFYEWISMDNAASLAMFEGLGFTADDVLSDCYVRAP